TSTPVEMSKVGATDVGVKLATSNSPSAFIAPTLLGSQPGSGRVGAGAAVVVDQLRARRPLEVAFVLQLHHRIYRFEIAEQPPVVVVGGSAGGVDNPPRCLEGDAVRVGEIDRAHDVVVDDFGDLAPVLGQPVAHRLERVLVGQVERQVVELR